MKRYMLVVLALLMLTVPLVVEADDQGWIPPEWTPTPPARATIDLGQLMQLLVTKGLISDQEYVQLTQPQSSSPTQAGQARVTAWEEVYHNPVQSGQ
jgi:hypothetical protein